MILSNKIGGFAWLKDNSSRFEGVYFTDKDVFKVIESITYPSHCSMAEGHDALIIQNPREEECALTLDCRKIFDNRQWGRNYVIALEHKCVVISFSMVSDKRDGEKKDDYELHLAVFGERLAYIPTKRWIERSYAFDQRRGSYPWTRWVFEACKLRFKDAVIAFSKNKATAIESAINVYAQRKRFKDTPSKNLLEKTTNAVHLFETRDGLFAGIPWFSQRWARDEIIATKALMLEKQYAEVKRILWHRLGQLQGSSLANQADAPGWLFLRIGEFLTILENDKKLKQFVSAKEREILEQKLTDCLDELFKKWVVKGVITCKPATWMDTTNRASGIELQALTLAMLRLKHKLTGIEDAREAALQRITKEHFFKDCTLIDSREDPILRPNLFLAVYIYPELLTKKEWIQVIDKALKKLWLPWGGLATREKDAKFQPQHTGERPESYHNGDSWFWVNHIAAIAMHRLDKKRYAPNIRKIMMASLSVQGEEGTLPELSSATALKAEGCPAQLWSTSTFVELLALR